MIGTINFSVFLDEYAFQAPYQIEHRESGMNNTTRMITAGADRFVLRVYNNHKDADIVRLEHEVLSELSSKSPPFRVPVPVRNKHDDTVCSAADGTLAALFYYIDGERTTAANNQHVFALGKTSGLLTRALSEIKPDRTPLYSPYYSLEDTYSAMEEMAFLALPEQCEGLAARRDSFILLQSERDKLKPECEIIAQLPKQWIHGDLVFNNTVSQGDEIVGVLDFEFTTVDVRAMELAVIAADLIKASDPEFPDKLKLLLNGYSEAFQLSEIELGKLPVLMKLRLLDVALHFALRYRDGLDRDDVLCGIIDQSAFGCKWINEHWEDR
ncbi:phosphotransferase [Paenibacillus sp. sgz302251]|uniref:phosphotransferase n=1 Tax=Paenibacillus sp. sgz302251 TaxID=3414493 RepID=UPI003C7D9B75